MSGFFDIISSEDRKEEDTVDFGEFKEWFFGELKEWGEFAWSNPDGRYLEVRRTLEDLEESLDELKGSELEEDMAPRLKKMGESNKKVLVSRLQSFVDTFEIPDDEDYETVHAFLRDKTKELDKVSEKIKKSLMVLDKVHSDLTKKVMNAMKSLESGLEMDENLEEVVDIIDRYQDLEDKRKELESLTKKIKKTEEELEDLMRDRERLEGELDEIKESEDTGLIKRKEDKLDGTEKEIDNLKDEVRGSIAPLKRGFKKLKYFGLTDDEELLENYIERPVEAAKDDGDLSFLRNAVEELKNKLDSRDLDFSDEEIQRLEKELDRTDIDETSELMDRIKDLESRKKSLEDDIEDLRTKDYQKEIEGKIRRKEEDIEEFRDRLEKREEREEALLESLKKEKEEIEEKVGELLNIDLDLEGVEP